jgi:hypothetical protein
MAVTYTNRLGDEYHLQVSESRTGKPVYSFTRKTPKSAVETVPDGFEIYESPERAQVFLRRIKPTRIRPHERGAVDIAISHLTELRHFIVDVDDDSLVVYTPGTDDDSATKLLEDIGLPIVLSKLDFLVTKSNYSKMMKFALVDPEKRIFSAARWCFRGEVERWISLSGGRDTLSKLLARYIPHLDKQSFFDLM